MANEIEFEGKTEADAVARALSALNVGHDRLDYTVVDEGSGGILGIGARPVRIRARAVAPAPAPVAEAAAPAPVAAAPVVQPQAVAAEAPAVEAPASGATGEDGDEDDSPGAVVGPAPEKAAKALEVARALIEKMGFQANLEVEDREREIVVTIVDADGGSRLAEAFAASRPPALPSIQFLLNKVVNRFPEGRKHVMLLAPGVAERQLARRAQRAEERTAPRPEVAPAPAAPPAPPPPLPEDVDPVLGALARALAEKARLTGRVYTLHPMAPGDRRSMHLSLEGIAGVQSVSDGEGLYRKLHILAKPTGPGGEGAGRRRRRRRRGGRGGDGARGAVSEA